MLKTLQYFCCKVPIKNLYKITDTFEITHVVGTNDLAEFETGIVHPFYATFALGREAEWVCRQFVLNMKEDDEEGIGVSLSINHRSPALLGETVRFVATITRLEKNAIDCSFIASVGQRVIAEGFAGQKILKKEKIEQLIKGILGG